MGLMAEEMATKYIGEYYRTAIEHFEMASNHLNNIKFYESIQACGVLNKTERVPGPLMLSPHPE